MGLISMKQRCVVGISRHHKVAVFDADGELIITGDSSKLYNFTDDMKILRFYVSDQCDFTSGIPLTAPVNVIQEDIWRKYYSVGFVRYIVREKVLKIVPGVKLSISSAEAEAVLIGLKGLGRKL